MPKVEVKICLAASAGGHLTQLLRLSESWQPYSVFFVSTMEVAAKSLLEKGRVYIVGECNRQKPFKLLGVLVKCARVILKERPDVVLSTGAAPGCILCLLGKLFGARIIWVDSIANVRRLSMSGRIIRPFADLFLTQWPQVAGGYKNVRYVGELL